MRLKTFGEWLRHQRLKKEISPFLMAEELGYKRVSAIYNFEYGIAPLPIPKWAALARILRMSIQEFLSAMDRYYPGKAAEFRAIQRTAGISGEPADKRSLQKAVSVISQSVLSGTPVLCEEAIQTFRAGDAEWILVTEEAWDDSLIVSVDRLRRLKNLKIGLVQVPQASALEGFPGPALVPWLKEAQGVLVIENGAGASASLISDRVKAIFVDALTAANGFPEVHRVPRIFTVSGSSMLPEWNAEIIVELIENISKRSGVRRLVLGARKARMEPLKTVDKLPDGRL